MPTRYTKLIANGEITYLTKHQDNGHDGNGNYELKMPKSIEPGASIIADFPSIELPESNEGASIKFS